MDLTNILEENIIHAKQKRINAMASLLLNALKFIFPSIKRPLNFNESKHSKVKVSHLVL